ncbi:hypothetical protein HDU76_010771 [Blyttiomyces sp. JEL0837]|nr:hypothetical protein HDU76_010771 [Blyttiomyces sp. JEL0837]
MGRGGNQRRKDRVLKAKATESAGSEPIWESATAFESFCSQKVNNRESDVRKGINGVDLLHRAEDINDNGLDNFNGAVAGGCGISAAESSSDDPDQSSSGRSLHRSEQPPASDSTAGSIASPMKRWIVGRLRSRESIRTPDWYRPYFNPPKRRRSGGRKGRNATQSKAVGSDSKDSGRVNKKGHKSRAKRATKEDSVKPKRQPSTTTGASNTVNVSTNINNAILEVDREASTPSAVLENEPHMADVAELSQNLQDPVRTINEVSTLNNRHSGDDTAVLPADVENQSPVQNMAQEVGVLVQHELESEDEMELDGGNADRHEEIIQVDVRSWVAATAAANATSRNTGVNRHNKRAFTVYCDPVVNEPREEDDMDLDPPPATTATLLAPREPRIQQINPNAPAQDRHRPEPRIQHINTNASADVFYRPPAIGPFDPTPLSLRSQPCPTRDLPGDVRWAMARVGGAGRYLRG